MATLFGKRSKKRRLDLSLKKEDEDNLVEDENMMTEKAAKGEEPAKHDFAINKTEKESTTFPPRPKDELLMTMADLGLAEPLVTTCRSLGLIKPSPIQRVLIPFLLNDTSSSTNNKKHHVLALAPTGSGKTAAFCLPLLHHLSADPYGIFAVILTPTRELAKQIHQQVLALGVAYKVQSALVVGGLDSVRQSCQLDQRPHFCVATPGRLAELLRGPQPPVLNHVRYLVLDEADRLLAASSGFEKDVAELLLHCHGNNNLSSSNDLVTSKRKTICQTLLFSATMTRSLESLEHMAGAGLGRLPLKKFVVSDEGLVDETKKRAAKKEDGANLNDDDDDEAQEESYMTVTKIPAGLKQEYIFMPSRVRDAYLLTTVRELMSNGGRPEERGKSGWTATNRDDENEDGTDGLPKARSAIVFVSSCERAAMVSGILSTVGVANVALHSLLSQNRRLAALGQFKSQRVRVLVATDVASRGLDIPTTDLVINAELPRNPISYVHRVGRTARAGRRGRAVSLIGETDVDLVHAAERVTGRPLEKCVDVTDDQAIKLLGAVTKAARMTKMKLMEIGFDELVAKSKERKARDKKDRNRRDKALKRMQQEKP